MRIACLLPDSLGDFILTTPSLHSLRKHFPNEEITCLIPKSLFEAARLFPIQANYLSFSERSALKTPDITVCFPPATRYYWLARRVGGRRRIGYVHEKMMIPRITSRLWLTHRWVCPENSSLHELQAYGTILSLIGVPFERNFPVPQTLIEGEPLKNLSAEAKMIAVHLGTRWTENPVPILHKLIRSDPDLQVVALFSEPEADRAKEMLGASNLKNLIVPHPGSLSQTLAILKRSSLFVGVDGGLIHLAAAAGIPTLAFYAADQFDFRVTKWHPWNVPYEAVPLTPDNIGRIPDLVKNMMKFEDEARASAERKGCR